MITGFVDNANAGLVHTVTSRGSDFNTSFEYGIDNESRGGSNGSTSFESTGESGQNFFVYFADNADNNSSTTLQLINGDDATGWGASGLALAFPSTSGMTVAPIVTALILGADRNSDKFSDLTATATSGGLFVESWDADSFTLGILSGVAIDNGAIVGYEIALQASAVPEPSTLGLIGLGVFGCVLRRRRRAVLA